MDYYSTVLPSSKRVSLSKKPLSSVGCGWGSQHLSLKIRRCADKGLEKGSTIQSVICLSPK